MHAILTTVLMLAASVVTPSKGWFAPDQPITVEVKPAGAEATLVLTDFAGKAFEPKGGAATVDVAADKTLDLREVFPEMGIPGTYVLFAVKKGAARDAAAGAPTDFLGTPLVVSVRQDTRQGAKPGPMVVRAEPLRYAVMETAHGRVTMAFYYDAAPNTAGHFLQLAQDGFFNGLTFHRIVPGFVIQGGDPRGDGTGSPGYSLTAEFSAKPHKEGVLSMARNGDPSERAGQRPRPEFANSAGSQFFICLDYANTRALDTKYTAFGEVTDGMEAVKKIAATPVADPATGRPAERQVIERIEVKPVTAAENPYAKLLKPTPPPIPGAAPGQ